ncbi:excinuclease ABC subunit UvrC [Gloeobacter violaceus]|uniref:UvrABC system protein C n=1 Tax=Gloeobacter violaceus (strain ATCC 29082 / PCC 7421) TaxID=251221 RepID=UVRC_GLOVI|nr:excinuclease ABC subunit UvrC [Gloeobacter violaceus]Q7NFD4.1 RecName: Full=UvrABC system protein C; Short=Protein UvrC; AltName: Full=Excinuclease ABC subunit C [Gloeobacter violaceus PCC 7421]BAC91533.1 excinuclease ABC subunit C [Gloeobacter violaceus PCC 7421]
MPNLIADPERLKERLELLPTSAGVYLMRDEAGEILYVGKAKNLRNRVRSYFQPGHDHSPRIAIMVGKVHDFELILTDTEAEALVLEDNLIKTHKPRYNVLLKDDKQYPYLCITWSEEYPRIFVTRRRGSGHPEDRYFGPYTDAGALHSTLGLLKKLFPLRQRNTPVFKDRPCINYEMGRCPGLCQRLISPQEYRATIRQIQMILQGRTAELLAQLEDQMQTAAAAMNFEHAARLRDRITGLNQLGAHQKITVPDSSVSRDAVALAADAALVSIQLFQVRSGKLIGRLGFSAAASGEDPGHILQRVLEEHYRASASEEIPLEVLTQHPLPEADILATWLAEKKGRKVEIHAPQRQIKAELVEMVARNAEAELQRLERFSRRQEKGLLNLAEALELPSVPRRMECYDISHIQGTDTVASRVVFVDGAPAKQYYRHYKIRDPRIVAGRPDDFASMAEVISRRFARAESEPEGDLPDLVVIDGGKGQLSAARAVMEELSYGDVPTIGLAKRLEEVFLPGRSDPVLIAQGDPALHLLQRIRDEAHRFAVSFHREQRGKRMTRSSLDDIPGIGPAKRKILLDTFRSVPVLEKASFEEIAKTPGIGSRLAQVIHTYFHGEPEAVARALEAEQAAN